MWIELGPIVKTQIHVAEVVHGGIYDAPRIMETDGLWFTAGGAVGVTRHGAVLDYHHRDHPELRSFKPRRQLSVGFTSHYEAMASRFGAAEWGIAAENLLIDHDTIVTEDVLAAGLAIDAAHGLVELAPAAVARPCIPFTRFMLGDEDAAEEVVADHRAFLGDGMRGFVLALVDLGSPALVAKGDTLLRRAKG